MTNHLPPQDEQSVHAASAEEGSQTAVPLQPSASQPVVLPRQQEEEEAFYFEEEQPDLEAAFVAPFQLSNAMPMVSASMQQPEQVSTTSSGPVAPTKKKSRKPRLSLTVIAILICVVVIVGMLAMNVLAQATSPLQTRGNSTSSTMQQAHHPLPQPTSKPRQPGVKLSPTATSGTTEWVPQQLPHGWTNAGLLTGDAIQALRTAVAFNDREMSLDYRNVGTRTNHGGTFTAATFLLTAAARQRFVQNDVRESSNTLFDTVVNTQLIRLVVDPQPRLVTFAQRGQQQLAWVDVAFQLWQSQIDPNTPQQRIEGKEVDPNTNQPRIHHMMVLLLHVSPQDAGNNPPMGGTGWLVSNYGLDLPHGTPLDIVQPV